MTDGPRTPIAAVVFDFDGVILESADVKTDAFVELYAAHGTAVVERVRAHHLANLGISRFKKFTWIAEHVLGQTLTDDASAALGVRFSDLALAKVLAAPFVPGAEAALAAVGALGLPMFVASGTPVDELRMIVERRGLARWFREVHGAPREKPEVLRDLLARYALSPAQVLFIGDGMSDYKAAHAVGTEFLARDTAALHDDWVALGVRRDPDLVRLPEVIARW
ncbi:MAG: HAD family hydrolase [Kofleriaceae bacterium]